MVGWFASNGETDLIDAALFICALFGVFAELFVFRNDRPIWMRLTFGLVGTGYYVTVLLGLLPATWWSAAVFPALLEVYSVIEHTFSCTSQPSIVDQNQELLLPLSSKSPVMPEGEDGIFDDNKTVARFICGQRFAIKARQWTNGKPMACSSTICLFLVLAVHVCALDVLLSPSCSYSSSAMKFQWMLILLLVVLPFACARISLAKSWRMCSKPKSQGSFSWGRLALYIGYSLMLQQIIHDLPLPIAASDPGLAHVRIFIVRVLIGLMVLTLFRDAIMSHGELECSAVLFKQYVYALTFPFTFVMLLLLLFGLIAKVGIAEGGWCVHAYGRFGVAFIVCGLIGRDAIRSWF